MRIDIWKPASDPSLQHHLGCGPRLPSDYWWVCWDEAWETFLEIQQSFAQDLQWETLNLIIREHRQQTAQLAWLFICTQTQYLIIMNWTNDKYLFSPSVESRGHPRQCAFITFSSVKLFCSECLKNILIAIVYLQFWCAGRSYLSSDQPLLWQ